MGAARVKALLFALRPVPAPPTVPSMTLIRGAPLHFLSAQTFEYLQGATRVQRRTGGSAMVPLQISPPTRALAVGGGERARGV